MKTSKEEALTIKNIRLQTRSTSWLSLILILLDIFLICLILLKVYPLGLCPKEGSFCEFLITLSALSVIYFVILLVLRCRQINKSHKLQNWRNPQNVRAAATYGIRTIFVIVWVLTASLSTALWTPAYVTKRIQRNTTKLTEEGWRILNCSQVNFNSSLNEVYSKVQDSSCFSQLYYTASGCLALIFVIAFLWLVMAIFMTNIDRHIGKKTTNIILKKTKESGQRSMVHNIEPQATDQMDYVLPESWPIEIVNKEMQSQEGDYSDERREQIVQDSITKFKNKLKQHQTNWFRKKPN